MDWILSLLSTLGIFAAALLILVFVHELGHFLAAKLFGMRVERFSLGFPPRIFGFKKGDTDYSIGATPLGGYVKISGMIDESMDTEHLDEEPKPWEYRSKPVWQRMIVITAGVIFNMILAAVIYAGIAYSTGETKIKLDSIEGMYVAENSIASQVGFQSGDKLIGVNGKEVEYFQDLFNPKEMTASSLSYIVVRDGEQVTIPIADSLLDDINRRGFISTANIAPSVAISQVQGGSPAEDAGFQSGDVIREIDGQEMRYLQQIITTIGASEDTLQVTVTRDGETRQLSVLPNENNQIGIAFQSDLTKQFEIDRFEYNLVESLGEGVHRSNETVTSIIQGFSKMFSGDISVRDNLGGPVAIASFTKDATDTGGAIGFWTIVAYLSITLAIINILPIPVLDGGHLMFLIYEGITRREPSPKVRMALQQIGFLIIIAIFIFVTFNDIIRQFG